MFLTIRMDKICQDIFHSGMATITRCSKRQCRGRTKTEDWHLSAGVEINNIFQDHLGPGPNQ